ncbi:U3 small nucleolar RNA-associated protein 4 [Ephemerocybe angulata]|uniref:U3 small nucleolar RNA-associated protein 4 n=1 Tax=Ephemerocybe angulata TaxID=980116 RepID=A0A8H6IIP0_9AGAR|nr:U3 small nucleolar RNA-associated protein 4 [Tulosesus angulatus]
MATVPVHRCRFVDNTPSAITALAFPPLPLPAVKRNRKPTESSKPLQFGTLAIGHANGNIDLSEWMGSDREPPSSQAWVVRQTLPGPYPSKVDALAFTIRYPDEINEDDVPQLSDLRLFSSGGGSELIEWDIQRSRIKTAPVRILSLENDTLTHHRRIGKVKCRMLSLAWGPPVPKQSRKPLPEAKKSSEGSDDSDSDDDDDEWADSWLVTGCSDSSLRKWDANSGQLMERIGMDKIRGERTLVWTVGVLGDGTIVSGDSVGLVKFWDSRTGTQLQSFQAHGADVLCMAISADGKTVYTSGVDQKTVQFSQVKTSSPDNSNSSSTRWAQTGSKRMHSHDVRALAILVLAPAALTSNTVVKIRNPLLTSVEATFEDAYHRRVAYFPGGLVSSVSEAGLTAPKRGQRKEGDKMDEDGAKAQSKVPTPGQEFANGWEKVLEMDLNVHTNIIAHEISEDGSWLAVSDLYETKLFHLQSAPNQHQFRGTGSLALKFTPDSSKLVLSTTAPSYIIIIDLTSEVPQVLRRLDHHLVQDLIVGDRLMERKSLHLNGAKKGEDVEMKDASEEEDEAAAESEAEDEDSPKLESRQRLSTTCHPLTASGSHPPHTGPLHPTPRPHPPPHQPHTSTKTHIYNLDSISHHTTLPSFPLPVQHLTFIDSPVSTSSYSSTSNLLLTFPNNSVQFPVWGKTLAAVADQRLRSMHDAVLGAFTASGASEDGHTQKKALIFWSATWMCKIGLDKNLVKPASSSHGSNNPLLNSSRKRRRGGKDEKKVLGDDDEGARAEQDVSRAVDFKMITTYRPILCVDRVSGLVIVERPLVDHRYGRS